MALKSGPTGVKTQTHIFVRKWGKARTVLSQHKEIEGREKAARRTNRSKTSGKVLKRICPTEEEEKKTGR